MDLPSWALHRLYCFELTAESWTLSFFPECCWRGSPHREGKTLRLPTRGSGPDPQGRSFHAEVELVTASRLLWTHPALLLWMGWTSYEGRRKLANGILVKNNLYRDDLFFFFWEGERVVGEERCRPGSFQWKWAERNHLGYSDLAWPRVCIPKRLTGDVASAGPWTTLGVARFWPVNPKYGLF